MWSFVGVSFLMWTAQQIPSMTVAPNDAQPRFEVASVKVSPEGAPFKIAGGPQTNSPERFTCSACSVDLLVRRAWNLTRFQFPLDPALYKDLFDVSAIVSSGTSPDGFRLMLQDLLKSRFSLVAHIERKTITTYELSIDAGGPKLKKAEAAREGAATDQPSSDSKPRFERGTDGRMQLVPGKPMIVIDGVGDAYRATARMQSISDIARFFEQRIGSPVQDKTGLTGLYDFILEFSKDGPGGRMGPRPDAVMATEASTPSPDLFAAIRRQLGLKLEAAKGPIDIFVIDSFSRTPTGN